MKDFSYSNLLFIHTVSCFDRFQCWLNSWRSPWHCRRSFLERKQANKVKIKHQGHAPNVILKLSGKNTRSIEGKLWKLTSRLQDAGKSLSPTSSTLARSWEVLRNACAVSMSRNLMAASCKSRRFVSSLFKSGRFRCCSFPFCFCKRIFNILVESLQRKQTDDFFGAS